MKFRLDTLLALPPRSTTALPLGTTAFLEAGCSPRHGATGVAPQATLRVCALDYPAPATDWEWVDITIDGVPVNDAVGTPARKIVEYSSGRSYLLLTPLEPFEPSSTHTLVCAYRNIFTLETLPYRAMFTVAPGVGYTGTTPNFFERAVLTPCTRLFDVEPLRVLLLDLALTKGRYGGAQDQARAARVLYQIAQDTDAVTLLNPYGMPDEPSFTSKVEDRRSRFALLEAITPHTRRIDNALAALVDGGPIPPALAPALVDGYDSALYTHRIATICVMPFLARAIENAAV